MGPSLDNAAAPAASTQTPTRPATTERSLASADGRAARSSDSPREKFARSNSSHRFVVGAGAAAAAEDSPGQTTDFFGAGDEDEEDEDDLLDLVLVQGLAEPGHLIPRASFFSDGRPPEGPAAALKPTAAHPLDQAKDMITVLLAMIQQRGGIARAPMEMLHVLVNKGLLNFDDLDDYQSSFQFRTEHGRLFLGGSNIAFTNDVLCPKCGTVYKTEQVWELPTCVDESGCHVPTCTHIALPNGQDAVAKASCGKPLFYSGSVVAMQLRHVRRWLKAPERVENVGGLWFVLRPECSTGTLDFATFLRLWALRFTCDELIALLRTHWVQARAQAAADHTLREIWDGQAWSDIIDPAAAKHPGADEIVLGLIMSFDFLSPFFHAPRSSSEVKAKKIGAAHLAMANIPISKRFDTANVCCTFVMENEPTLTINGFTAHVIEHLVEIGRDGVKVQTRDNRTLTFFPRLLMLTADSPAKSKMAGISHHSALEGCPKCQLSASKAAGEGVSWRGQCSVAESAALRRTLAQTVEDVRFVQHARSQTDATLRVRARCGVRFTPFVGRELNEVHRFDLINHTAIDVMHAGGLGVGKTLLNKLMEPFTTEAQRKPFIDAIELINLTIPKGASHLKVAKSLLFHLGSAKAATLITFIVTHSEAVLFGLIPEDQYAVWRKFVRCCRVFFALELTQALIDEVETLYEQFVHELEVLFPAMVIPFNMHLLTHMPANMRTFGPSFGSWCFGFERLMGAIRDFPFSSSRQGLIPTTTHNLALQQNIAFALSRLREQNRPMPSGIGFADLERCLDKLSSSFEPSPVIYRLNRPLLCCNELAAYQPSESLRARVADPSAADRGVRLLTMRVGDLLESDLPQRWPVCLSQLLESLSQQSTTLASLLSPARQLNITVSREASLMDVAFREQDKIAGWFHAVEGAVPPRFQLFGTIQLFLSIELDGLETLLAGLPEGDDREATRRLFPLTLAYVFWHENVPASPTVSADGAESLSVVDLPPIVKPASSAAQSNNLIPISRIAERVTFGQQLKFRGGCPVVSLPFSVY